MLTRSTFLQVSTFIYTYRHVILAAVLLALLILTFVMPSMVALADGISGPGSCPGGC